jgi:23S rRNA (adenine1618-N6)-methyltransferase
MTNLCPRIPSRINYLLWLSINVTEPIDIVLDVGTGATLIYPLIGRALYKWSFIAIEINKQSYESSRGII